MTVGGHYDQNTTPFLRWGSGLDLGAIHRQVWAPGVRTPAESLLTVNRLIAAHLERAGVSAEDLVLDRGCGVGGTLTWLGVQIGQRGLGLILSAGQARHGRV